MFYTIYMTTNTINNKIYIGKHKTKDLNDDYLGSGKLLQRAIEKYGIENFKKEILYVFDNEEEMNSKEKELVTEEFLKREDVYNLCPGGQGGFGYINENKLTDVSKAGRLGRIISDKKLKEKYGDNWKSIISKKGAEKRFIKYGIGENFNFKNKFHSEETKNKISNSMKYKQTGPKNSQFGTCWITNGTENKKIKKEDLCLWEEKGYSKGRKIK